MDAELLKKIIEGALFAAGQPLNIEQLGFLFDEGDRPDNATMREALEALMKDYEGRGIELKEVASGFRFQVRQETGPWVSRLWEEKPSRYSRALLETLALIAYRQPITRSEIEEIRGVSVSSHIIKTLLEREWIRVAGHRDVPGRPALFATTREFLDSFNLKTLAELPSLSEIRDLERINEELEFLEAQERADAEAGLTGEDEADAQDAEKLAEVMADLEADIEREELDGRGEDQIYE
ncbi:MAG TPA: SMC-Scp complex subunit ScpB [Moraxellaceae bacterium]|nr:SMC-Scp complex subunit ScpB [Moraxellaceae bacterium]